MNPWLVGAAALVFVIGLAHSWLGERMVFRHLRTGGLVPDGGQPGLRAYQTRILWASWHVVTALATALALRGGRVLLSNRGRHPAWIALLAAAALVLMSQR